MTAPARYRLSFTVGGLLAKEAAIAVPVYLGARDWIGTRRALLEGNLLNARTHRSAVRTSGEVVQRLACLYYEELIYFAGATGPERNQLMWVAMCRSYPFVAEFAEQVVRDKYLLGTPRLRNEDFERFFASRALWHTEVEALSASTQVRLRQNLYLALREAGLLTNHGEIERALLSGEVARLLGAEDPSGLRYFPTSAGGKGST